MLFLIFIHLSKLMKLKTIFILTIFLNYCSLFPPISLKEESLLNVEEEIPGNYKGVKFFFNRYGELTKSVLTKKECSLLSLNKISCIENYLWDNQEINKEYCYFYQYRNPYDIYLKYSSNCKNESNLITFLFSEYNKIRPGGFILISSDIEPLKQSKFFVSIYYIRSIQNKYYYEEKNYYFLFWKIGKEITLWEK
jgi:hypothetical protein